MEDSFNASGRARARQRKTIQLEKKDAPGENAGPLDQLADAAAKGQISKQAKGFSNIDGFDNAEGKKRLSDVQRGAVIGFTALLLTAGLVLVIRRMAGVK